MSFKEILNTFKKQEESSGILGRLDRYLISLDGKPFKDKEQERERGVFHPSQLSTANCLRALVYWFLETPPSNSQKTFAKGRRIFDVGHSFGYILQQYFWDMGILEGMYKCIKCDNVWWDVSPRYCKKCKEKLYIWHNLHYLEVPIHNKKWNVKGHADGILKLNKERVLIELKSIKNRDKKTSQNAVTFDDLNQALTTHVQQANLYLDGLNEMGMEIEKGIIIYFAKNTQDMKEFPIRKMDMMLEPSYQKIRSVNHSLETKVLPERAGESKSDTICKYCPYKDYCWDNDYSFEQSDFRKGNK